MNFIKKHTGLTLFLILAALFIYFNRHHHHHLSQAIKSYGSEGIVAAILVMMIMCLTPIPTEGLLLVYYNVYDPIMGTFYAWFGYLLSTLILFVVSRYIGKNYIQSRVSKLHTYYETVERWIIERKSFGVLVVRTLPIPAFIVNLILGTMVSINFLTYFWTAVIAILPYYIYSGCLYYGITGANYISIGIGLVVLILMWFIGYRFRKLSKSKED